MSQEYVFVLDVSGAAPVQRQAIAIPNTFQGLAWAPDGDRFYVSGGVDDVVYEYARGADGFQAARGALFVIRWLLPRSQRGREQEKERQHATQYAPPVRWAFYPMKGFANFGALAASLEIRVRRNSC